MQQIDWIETIPAFDSYNRQYLAGIDFTSELFDARGFNNIGDYQFLSDASLKTDLPDQPFQAAAYQASDGSVVISYRGTDQIPGDIPSWLQGAGTINEAFTQAAQAEEYFRKVITYVNGGSTISSPVDTALFDANVTFVGHSLGGGLAGYMAALYGKEAYIFDQMPFQLSAAVRMLSMFAGATEEQPSTLA